MQANYTNFFTFPAAMLDSVFLILLKNSNIRERVFGIIKKKWKIALQKYNLKKNHPYNKIWKCKVINFLFLLINWDKSSFDTTQKIYSDKQFMTIIVNHFIMTMEKSIIKVYCKQKDKYRELKI